MPPALFRNNLTALMKINILAKESDPLLPYKMA